MPRRTPPILLANPDFYGTLAAVRCLGRRGVPVVVAGPRWLAPARWSRFIARHIAAPSLEAPERFMDWLFAFGRRNPGHVLYATSDELAWLFALHRGELSQHFELYQPGVETIAGLLDKRALLRLCDDVGIETPTTFIPQGPTAADVERQLADAVRHGSIPIAFPLLLKPTTQVLLRVHLKGAIVPNPKSLVEQYSAFAAATAHHPLLLEKVPTARFPMLQAYYPDAAKGIYSIAGFVDADGEVTALAARKILQHPRKLGIGLCFESAPVHGPLVEKLRALCLKAGYFGVFEAEFIDADGRALLIDFNPRFYGQMAFEVARGLPLPMIAYEAALGRFEVLAGARRALAASTSTSVAAGLSPHVYLHRGIFELLTRSQRMFGSMTRADAARWQGWRQAHAQQAIDAVFDRSDPMPAVADMASTAYGYFRHPRAFIRSVLLDR